MTTLYLAWSPSGASKKTFDEMSNDDLRGVALLVSFPYLRQYRSAFGSRETFPRELMLDSGAFSAWNSGKEIDINALTQEALHSQWDETVALDVVGDPTTSMANASYMRARGAMSFPVFHFGEPWEALAEMCGQYEKVGLSCRFGEPVGESERFICEAFYRQWPHRFHSFGWVKRSVLEGYPFESADTASWNLASQAFGRWASLGGIGRHCLNARSEIDHYLEFEKELKTRWRMDLATLDA